MNKFYISVCHPKFGGGYRDKDDSGNCLLTFEVAQNYAETWSGIKDMELGKEYESITISGYKVCICSQ